MTDTIEKTEFKFEELDESAQQAAIENNYDFNVSHDWWDFTYDDADTIGLKLTGFDLGRGRNITGEFTQSGQAVADAIIKNHGSECDTYKLAESYLKDYTVINVTASLTQDDDETESKIEELTDEFKKDLLNAYWKTLEQEYEYLTSDECIKESLISNDYDFDEDGTII